MTTLFVRHKVQNFDSWKRGYDEFASTRKEMGVTGASVHCDANDPNDVTVTHRFGDINAATAFANSEDLKSTMMNAGVVGAPDIWFTEDIEQTPY